MEMGIVKWFDSIRGYGFISRENEKDLFFHATGLDTSKGTFGAHQGDRVTFQIGKARDGRPVAIKVHVIASEWAENERQNVKEREANPYLEGH